MSIMEEETVKVTVEGTLATFTVNRPQSLNALNPDVLQSLILAFEKLKKTAPDTRVVVITGEGKKAFVAGADIQSMSQLGPRAIADYVELGQRCMRTIELSPVVVVAAMNGYALGGGLELALACDLIVASTAARVGQPEVNLGIIPGFGGTQRLIERCGIGAARRLVLTGEILDAQEALRLGIVDKVCAPEELESVVRDLAATVAAKGPLAVARGKEVLRRSRDAILQAGLRTEVEAFLELFATADREEGMTAFLHKREPKFSGR